MPWLRHVQGTDARYIAATQLLPYACELAKEEYHEWADGLFPSLSCVHDEYRDWAIGNELMYLEQEGVPMPTRVPVPPVSVAEPTAEETPLEKLKARLQGIKERRSPQQRETQLRNTQAAPCTPAQQQRPNSHLDVQEPSPVFDSSSPAQLTQQSSKMTPDQTPRSPVMQRLDGPTNPSLSLSLCLSLSLSLC